MDKKILYLLVLVIILGVLVGFAVFGSSAEADIRTEIENANYCENTSDCTVVFGQCPFGCYLPVNNSAAGRIESLVSSYESNCAYICIELKGVKCVNNKCMLNY